MSDLKIGDVVWGARVASGGGHIETGSAVVTRVSTRAVFIERVNVLGFRSRFARADAEKLARTERGAVERLRGQLATAEQFYRKGREQADAWLQDHSDA